MPYFVMNRNYALNSTQGASANFRKDKPEFVPEFLRAEVEDKGGVEVDEPPLEEPFSVPVQSVTNTAPVVCIVDPTVMYHTKTGDTVVLNTDPAVEGTITAVTPDSFTIDGTDLTAEPAPLTGVTATITPVTTTPPYRAAADKYKVCEDVPPTDAADREAALHAVFERMVIEGKAGDDHVPTVRDTSEAVGFKVTAAERDEAWESFKAGS